MNNFPYHEWNGFFYALFESIDRILWLLLTHVANSMPNWLWYLLTELHFRICTQQCGIE